MIEYLAKVAGYAIDFSNISDIEMIEASIDAFNCDYDKMTRIFGKITKPITKEEQEDFIKEIAAINSPVIKAYNSITENKPLD
jgi:cell filamentation protein